MGGRCKLSPDRLFGWRVAQTDLTPPGLLYNNFIKENTKCFTLVLLYSAKKIGAPGI